MPIQIKELHIKINIEEPTQTQSTGKTPTKSKEDKDDLLASCVEAVMELLEKQKER